MTTIESDRRRKAAAFELYIYCVKLPGNDPDKAGAWEKYLAEVRYVAPSPAEAPPPSPEAVSRFMTAPIQTQRREDPTAKTYRRIWP